MNKKFQVLYASPKKVAELFGLNYGTLANLRSRKHGPPFTKLGRKVLYRISEVANWIEDYKKCSKHLK